MTNKLPYRFGPDYIHFIVVVVSWLRENFAERRTREQSLSELGDPTPAEVEAPLTRTSAAAPGVEDAKTTRLLGPKAREVVRELG